MAGVYHTSTQFSFRGEKPPSLTVRGLVIFLLSFSNNPVIISSFKELSHASLWLNVTLSYCIGYLLISISDRQPAHLSWAGQFHRLNICLVRKLWLIINAPLYMRSIMYWLYCTSYNFIKGLVQTDRPDKQTWAEWLHLVMLFLWIRIMGEIEPL